MQHKGNLWFTLTPDNPYDEPCYCEFCIFPCFAYENILKPYEDVGLDIVDGSKITISMVVVAAKISLKRLLEINQPSTLENISIMTINDLTKNKSDSLPLPTLIKKKINDFKHYTHDYVNKRDSKFTFPKSKQFVGILWNHIGYWIVKDKIFLA